MDTESLRIVAEDLVFLRDWHEEISDPEIRRGSATLRRLLIENVYGTAWRAAGFQKEPTLSAVDLAHIVATVDIASIDWVVAAGALFRGLNIANGMLLRQGTNLVASADLAAHQRRAYPGLKGFGLTAYLRSHSAYAFGEWITRADVIKYIANVKGGVHLSASQRRREAQLVDRVGKIEKRITIGGAEGLLVEIVAIAQAVGSSNDASRFISLITSTG